MSFVPALLAKLTLVLVLGLTIAASLRHFGPSLRHLILFAAVVSGLMLPVVMVVSPQWNIPVLPRSSSTLFSPAGGVQPGPITNGERVNGISLSRSQGGATNAPASSSAQPATLIDARSTQPSRARGILVGLPVLPLIWALGLMAVLLWLATGRVRLRRIARSSWPLDGPEWTRILDEERKYAGVNKPVLLFSSSVVSTPLTWGSRAPVVLLPEDALDWPEEHRRIVLRHELAHIGRGDSFTQLVAGLACALYWFHPLVWVAERRLRAECERACDDSVVSLGTPPAEYAAHLLEVARSARAFGAPGFLSVAMARPSQLEGRLLAVLSESRRRVSVSRGARPVAALLSLLVLIPLAAMRAVPKVDVAAARGVDNHDVPGSTQSLRSPATTAPTKDISTVPSEAIPATPVSKNAKLSQEQRVADTTFQLSVPARSAGTLILDLRTGGNVVIAGWDKPQVLVRASLGGRDWRVTRVNLTPENGDARLESNFAVRGNNQSSRHAFEISVPRNYNIRLSSSGGSLSIAGVDGRFTGHTGGGEINIEKASGEAHIQTGGGDIYIRDSRLNGTVSTGGGVVRIIGNTGDLNGSSGSGPVIHSSSDAKVNRENGVSLVAVGGGDNGYTLKTGSGAGSGSGAASASVSSHGSGVTTTTTYAGDGVGKASVFGANGISMNSAGGALSLASAPDGARVTTGGGSIRIGRSGGQVYASTGGGPIDIGPASGSVEAHTGAGDVTIELVGSGAHSVDVTSGKGQVVLVVPRDLNARLELETAYTNNLGHKTRIVSDMPLQTTETATWDDSEGTPRRYVRARQTVGRGGAVIRVRTVNGDILVNHSR
jgi:beta-lactamase regulating signal transducer with metallopeptidase domain